MSEEDLDVDSECWSYGCDIREGDIECRRCGAEVVQDEDDHENEGDES